MVMKMNADGFEEKLEKVIPEEEEYTGGMLRRRFKVPQSEIRRAYYTNHQYYDRSANDPNAYGYTDILEEEEE